jgi:GWxTD domain-containing protein
MKNRIIQFWMALIIVMVLFHQLIRAQLPEFSFRNKDGSPNFYYDMISYAGKDSSQSILIVSTRIAYDELQFIRTDTNYQASYELSVTIFDQLGYNANSKILKNIIELDGFEKTNSRKDYSLSQIKFSIIPGTYELLLGIMDFDSKITSHRKTKVIVPQYYTDNMMISDILLADSIITDSLGQKIPIPNVMGNYEDDQNALYLWYQIYNPRDLVQIKIHYGLINYKKEEVWKEDREVALDGWKTDETMKIPRGELKSGRYKLVVELETEKRKVERARDITIHWLGMPRYASTLDNAIEQLKYVAKGSEMRKMEKSEGKEKEQLFREFWASKDPTPGTEENELMEEYYRRVDFTNANFGTFIDGWRTDRGMVYIVLGPPNDIERHPFEAGSKPYEIWSYYKINREFIFVDYTGFGEYRLITPFWEVLDHMQ